MASFSELYAKALKDLGPRAAVPSATAPAKADLGDPWAGMSPSEPAAPESANPDFFKDPVGATLDFISRGAYGATNVATKAVDDTLEAAQKAASGDVGGALWDTVFKNPLFGMLSPAADIAQTVAGQNVKQSFGEGLTTSDPEKKRLFSDVIEQSTDKIGAATDPNYIDRVDNVAGPVKGIAGFAADMALDPTTYIPLPVGAIAKLARGGKKALIGAGDAVKTLRTGKPVEELADEAATAARLPATAPDVAPLPPRVSPREAMSIPMPEALPKPVLDEAIPGVPSAKQVDTLVEPAKIDPEISQVTPEVPEVATTPAPSGRPEALTPEALQKAFGELPAKFEVPEVGNVTAKAAQDIYLKLGSGKKLTPRQAKIYEHVALQTRDRVTAPPVATPPPAVAPAAPVLEPRQEAADVWRGLSGAGISVGTTPLTRDILEQAFTMEKAGELPEEWVSHLRFFREESALQREFDDTMTSLRAAQADTTVATPTRDAADEWLDANDVEVTPKNEIEATHTQRAADDLSDRKAVTSVPAAASLTPSEIIAASGQAERMRKLLDTVEMMVRGGEIPAIPERSPIIPGTKGFGYSEQVVADYAASFDYWVMNGLDDLADAKGMIEIPRVQGEMEWTEKVAVSDVRSWLKAVEDYDTWRPNPEDPSLPWVPDIDAEDYARLTSVDALFREEINAGMVMNPAKEAVQIVNVLDAWKHLLAEQTEFLQTNLGDEGYRYLLNQMNGNEAKVAQRMKTMRDMLEPGYGLDDLAKLQETQRLNNTRPILEMLAKELGLTDSIDNMTSPAPAPGIAGTAPGESAVTPPAPEPEVTAPVVPPVQDPVSTAQEVATKPSNVTPAPSTPEEVTEVLDALVEPQPGATPEQAQLLTAAGNVLRAMIGRDIHDIAKVAPHRTKRTGAYRDSTVPGEGNGWHLKKLNTQSQYSMEAAVFKESVDLSKVKFKAEGRGTESVEDLYSLSRARVLDENWLEIHNAVDTALDKAGVKQVIGKAENIVPLSFLNIYTDLTKAMTDMFGDSSEYVRLLLFQSGKTRVNWTNLAEATRLSLFGANRNEIKAALLNTTLPNGKGAMPNNFAEKGLREGFHMTLGESHRAKWIRGSVEAAFPRAQFPKSGKTHGDMQWIKIPGEDLADTLAAVIERGTDDLAKTAVNNGWRQTERGIVETYDMADETLQLLDDLYMDPNKMSEFLRQAANIPETIAKRATEQGAYKESADAASDAVRTSVGDDIVDNAENLVAIDRSQKNGSKATQKAIDESSTKRVKSSVEVIDQEVDEANARAMLEGNVGTLLDNVDDDLDGAIEGARQTAEIYDLSARYDSEAREGFAKLFDQTSETFRASHNQETIWGLGHAKAVSAQEFLAKRHLEMSHLAKQYPRQDIADAWQRIQLGTPAKDPLQASLQRMISSIWDPGEDALFSNHFLNVEKNLDYVNALIDMKFSSSKSTHPQFDVGAAKSASIAKYKTPDLYMQFLADQWRAWNVGDPLDFLSRMTDAAVTIAERKSIVENFVSQGYKMGWISKTPKPGYVKPTHTSNRSAFSVFLPEGVYVEKEMMRELHYADILTHTSRQLQGEIGEFIRKTYMPLQDAWKVAITIFRPGHHIRNQIGDSSITWVKRGNRAYAKSASDAFKVMSMRNDYTDVDLIRALKHVDGVDAVPPRQGDVLVKGMVGGKEVSLTASQIFDYLHIKGLRPSFHLGEGLFDDSVIVTKLSKVAKRVALQETKSGAPTKLMEVAGGVSQARDHWSRAQHFIQILHQEMGKGGPFTKQFSGVRDLEDLIDRAAAEVKKYHPDASMLTPRESKYFRVVIPFYSWFSKILPAVMESALRNPGRVSALPKASYELAVSTGVNPDSIADPFPEDQLFPSFLTDKALGPQFQVGETYFGMNPGLTHLDIMNTFGPDPWRGILGMTSPLLRVPFELAAGGQIGTGARINDQSDYIDSNIPGVNYLANVTGISPSGTLASLLSGTPALDQQYQVAKGNKGEFGSEDTWLTAMNWAAGLGVQDMSRPNYINYAELEQKRGEVPSK